MKSTDGIYLGKLSVQISMKMKKKKQGPTLITKHATTSVTDACTGPTISPRPPLVQQIVDLEECSTSRVSKFARYQEVRSGTEPSSVTGTKMTAESQKIKPFFALGKNGKEVIGELVERAEKLHLEMVQSVMENGVRPRSPELDVR